MKIRYTRYIFIIVTLLSLGLLSGCWDLREINQSSIPTGVGVDLVKDNRIVFSTLLIRPTAPSESGANKQQTFIISTEDYGVAMAARRLTLSLSLVPEWAHAKTFLLGEGLAKKDLSMCIDFMTRNRNIRPDTNLMVCIGATPAQVLSSQLPQATNLGTGLMDMLTLNQHLVGIYVPITVEEFSYRLATPGIEPAVPQLRLVPRNNDGLPASSSQEKPGGSSRDRTGPELHGMAVFKKNKMVGSLNEYESRGYRWLSSASKYGGFFTIKSPLNPDETVGLEIINFSSQVKPQLTGNNITMNVEVRAKLGVYDEAGTGQLLTMKNKLEQAANMEIARQIEACINKSQTLQSDIVGWGQIINISRPAIWKNLRPHWNMIFPSVGSKITVKTQLSRSYLSNKSFQPK